MKFKFKKLTAILMIFIVLSLMFVNIVPNISNAADEEFSTSEYSERYKEWLELSEEEKSKVIIPPMYDIDFSTSNSGLYKNTVLPAKYDLRDTLTLAVRNQQSTGSCWAFASNVALQTNIEKLKQEDYIFSPRFVEYATSRIFSGGVINPVGRNRTVGDGGNSHIAFNAYITGNGPVLEADLPFENNEDSRPISIIQNKDVIKRITGYIEFPNKARNQLTEAQILARRNMIKEHLMTYGAVTTAIIAPQTGYAYWNATTRAWYFNLENYASDHLVTIVGWDDDYSRTNFNASVRPSKDGAYLIKNSWGTTWGNNGYYWISYEDTQVERDAMGVLGTSDMDYDRIHQHGFYGKNSYNYYNGVSTAWGVNVYEKGAAVEYLNEISIATMQGINYEIFVNRTDGDYNTASKFQSVKVSTTIGAGYHSVKIDPSLQLTGTKFAIKVKYTSSDGSTVNLARESITGDAIYGTSKAGQSYISTNGTSWSEISNAPTPANLCIKAFTTLQPQTVNAQAPTITLTQPETGRVTANVTSNSGTNIVKLKWDDGGKNIDYFKSHGKDVSPAASQTITRDFTSLSLGKRYTVYAEDASGNKSVQVVTARTVINGILRGDFNRDGIVSASDAYVILQFVAFGGVATAEDLAIGDVNNDGKIGASDAYMVLQYVAGLIKSLD